MQTTGDISNPRILIVGAGPAGLSTAYFLKQAGYTNVTVFEKLGRVGGLCYSITDGEHSYDLGANYVTPAYTELLKIAEEMGAKLYSEKPFVAMKVPEEGDGPVEYQSIFDALRVNWRTGEPVPVLRFMLHVLKFTWLRFKLRSIIDRPTMAHIEDYKDGELCEPLLDWLRKYDLESIATLFDLPITMMGYGYVDETAAAYALKFMTIKTFVPMVLKETPIIGSFIAWPKRFVLGYQRLWEKLSWELDVELNIDIQRIRRENGKVTVHFRRLEQILNSITSLDDVMEFDYLILACPLTLDNLSRFLDLSDEERNLFHYVTMNAYAMTTFHVKNLRIGGKITGAGPLAAAFYFSDRSPRPELPFWKPWGVAKQWFDSDFVQYYTMVPTDFDPPAVQGLVEDEVRKLTQQMGGEIVEETREWHTFNIWPYFQHVAPECIKQGFYTQLEQLQGHNNTFYVGGATNFELIEVIVRYAKNLVAQRFPAKR